MTKHHTPDHYQDGFVRVAFCNVCGAEGLRLLEDCQGTIPMTISLEQRKMAAYLGLHHDLPDTWPMDVINRFVDLEAREGNRRLHEEIRKFVSYCT